MRIDGSTGEGGGQVLRTALALSLCLDKPVRIVNIRAKRKKPGLRPQHLTSVLAAAEISQAEVTGAELSSTDLIFKPHRLSPGNYRFIMATAGSTTLVLQTILPALLTASGPSHLILEGGTHNPMAPPFDFLVHGFLPILQRMGSRVSVRLWKPGFYPAGGGRIGVDIDPVNRLNPIELLDRGRIMSKNAVAVVSRLPEHIACRELDVIRHEFGLPDNCLETRVEKRAKGPGNVMYVMVESEQITEVFTGFGLRGVRAEKVARGVAREMRRYLEAEGAAAGKYLADQLLLPFTLAGEGAFSTMTPSRHTLTNMEIIRLFTGRAFLCQRRKNDVYYIELTQ